MKDTNPDKEKIEKTPDALASEPSTQLKQDYWSIVKRQFRKNTLAVWSLRFLFAFIFIALIADFVANEKPIYCKMGGQTYFPVIKDYGVALGLTKWPADLVYASWKDLEYEQVVWPLVPYLPTNLDFANSPYVGPFDDQEVTSTRWRHWLGTDDLGRDVLSGMIHASRIALSVGVVAMAIAFVIGIFFGSLAGYFGDHRLKISRIRLILNIVFLYFGVFFGFGSGQFSIVISLVILIGAIVLSNLISTPMEKIGFLGKRINLAMDILVSRLIEVMRSVPTLLLILSIVAVTKPSIWIVMAIIGATSWTGIARFLRGELLRVRSLEYVEAAQALGYGEFRIILRHAIPNSLTPVMITVAFGIASAILTEAFLSFLGIGLPSEMVTWGTLLSLARKAPEAWWLAVIPGFAIFITVTVFNLLGEGLTDALDPRLKS